MPATVTFHPAEPEDHSQQPFRLRTRKTLLKLLMYQLCVNPFHLLSATKEPPHGEGNVE